MKIKCKIAKTIQRERKKWNIQRMFLAVTLVLALTSGLCACSPDTISSEPETTASSEDTFDLSSIPAYNDSPYVAVNHNMPYFTDGELTSESFESYSSLDALGRCGAACASIGQDLMPTEERGSIGQVKPSGWHTSQYGFVDGNNLYNRCHLIGYQLTAENANEKNLITGTRYLNVEGMLPFENMVADYVKETGSHVLYRVTPVFSGTNLVADGVLMEAESVEDGGEGILFNVFCYNVQPGVTIDYATGDNWLDETTTAKAKESADHTAGSSTRNNASTSPNISATYILNTNTKKFHYPDCPSVGEMKDHNKKEYTGNRDELISQGYSPCRNCNP